MKLSVTIIAILMSVLAYAQKEVKTYYDPFQQTKIKERYFVNSKNQKHGKYIKYDDRGLKAVEGNFSNGKPQGVVKEYALPLVGYPGDEKVKKEANYVNGNQHGKTSYFVYIKDGKENIKDGKKILQGEEFYENGKKIREIGYFIDGKKEIDAYLENGVQKKWYDNGQLAIELHVENGSFNGAWKEWYTNGQIGVDGLKKKGKFFGEKKEYYVDGTLKSVENYALGDINGEIFEGIQIYNDSTGVLIKQYNFSPLENGIQTKNVNKYYSNGNKKAEYPVIISNRKAGNFNSKMTGEYKEYFDNGNISIIGHIDEKGYRDGIWKLYDKNGNETLSLSYKNGNKIGDWIIYYDENWEEVYSKEEAHFYRELKFTDEGKIKDNKVIDYYINGNKQFEGFLINLDPDVEHGNCIYFHKNGNKMSEGEMKKGYKTGVWKDYYPNGNIKLEYQFIVVNPHVDQGSEKHGKWSYYDENGSLEKIEIYNRGSLEETKTGDQAIEEEITAQKKNLLPLITKQQEHIKSLYVERIPVGENYIEKLKKRNLYKSYELLSEHYITQINQMADLTSLNQLEIKISALGKKMEELIKQDTKAIEKSLKKASSPSEIESILTL